MQNKIFRKIIDRYSKAIGLENKWGAWIKESDETLIAVILRKSGYSNQYYLRIKIHIKDKEINSDHKIDKEWIKNDIADILTGNNNKFNNLLDLENSLDDMEREQLLLKMYKTNISEIITKALTIEGIIKLSKKNKFILLPHTQKKLGIK